MQENQNGARDNLWAHFTHVKTWLCYGTIMVSNGNVMVPWYIHYH